jgi:HK97 family phage major capsid protein
VLSGLKGDALIPKLETDTGAVWTPQNPGSDISDTTPTFGNVGLTPHELVGTTSYSRQLLAQSVNSADVDTLVRADLARVHGVAIDAAALNGSGSSGQPQGILNRADLGAQLLAFGTNGLIPTWPLIAQLELLASVLNGNVNPETSAYIVTPEIRYRFRTTDRTSGTSGWFIMVDDNDINEYPVIATNQLPKNLTKGTSNGVCHAIVFGDFSQMLIGMWAGFEIIADPFRLKKQGMVEVTTYQLADTSVRHIKAFAVSKDALP